MFEILEKIFIYLPQYFIDCGMFLSGPKSFTKNKLESDVKTNEIFIFIGITSAIGAIVSSILPSGVDASKSLIISLITNFIGIVLFSLIIRAGWWIVGGRAPYKKFFAVYAYQFCPIFLVNLVFQMIAFGLMRVIDTETYLLLSKTTDLVDRGRLIYYFKIGDFMIYPYCVIIGASISTVYSIVGWGAFREINHLSKLRSLIAYIIIIFLTIPAYILYLLIIIAIS